MFLSNVLLTMCQLPAFFRSVFSLAHFFFFRILFFNDWQTLDSELSVFYRYAAKSGYAAISCLQLLLVLLNSGKLCYGFTVVVSSATCVLKC